MSVDNLIVKENEYQGKIIKQLYVVYDNKEYLVGTLKDKSEYGYVNCIHKEFKK